MGPEARRPDSARLTVAAARRLAPGAPVDPAVLAPVLGWPPARVDATLRYLDGVRQLERDVAGHLVGVAGLTLRRTPHRFEVGGRGLYTWCAVDALFLPAVLGTAARVTSTCPASGTAVRLTVSPGDGAPACDPAGAVVGLMVPTEGGTPAGCDPTPLFGPGGAFCGNVHFFRSEADAAPWLAAHPGAVVLPVAEAHRLAVDMWARPLLAHADR